ncbi:Pyrroline-5-carboxylate reductase [Smittium mucronatum]|uniref:Pyrroline-5-carboxylate reductase n=1 Tax=Smittium mucronatum TaxID=133383 RepID=A0A1R0H1J8_9FUNG|nr:Pyrroline-5-carboxylate reductase [Smittium mucronatum]
MSASPRISIIGGGNIAEAIISGLVKGGQDPSLVSVADPYPPQLEKLSAKYGVQTFTNNTACLAVFKDQGPEVLIIATKPQIVSVVMAELSAQILEFKPVIVSIAAGITTSAIHSWICSGDSKAADAQVAIVRLMPNTPALIGEGAAGLFRNTAVSDSQAALAISVAAKISKQYFWFASEGDIDSVTAISGSGPAYFFYVMEAMQAAAVKFGLGGAEATKLVAQTCLGAAKMVLENEDVSIATLRERVTSPNGTTFAAIESMKADNVSDSIIKACQCAKDRSEEISAELFTK